MTDTTKRFLVVDYAGERVGAYEHRSEARRACKHAGSGAVVLCGDVLLDHHPNSTPSERRTQEKRERMKAFPGVAPPPPIPSSPPVKEEEEDEDEEDEEEDEEAEADEEAEETPVVPSLPSTPVGVAPRVTPDPETLCSSVRDGTRCTAPAVTKVAGELYCRRCANRLHQQRSRMLKRSQDPPPPPRDALFSDINAWITQGQKLRPQLEARRQELAAQLAQLDALLTHLPQSPPQPHETNGKPRPDE